MLTSDRGAHMLPYIAVEPVSVPSVVLVTVALSVFAVCFLCFMQYHTNRHCLCRCRYLTALPDSRKLYQRSWGQNIVCGYYVGSDLQPIAYITVGHFCNSRGCVVSPKPKACIEASQQYLNPIERYWGWPAKEWSCSQVVTRYSYHHL